MKHVGIMLGLIACVAAGPMGAPAQDNSAGGSSGLLQGIPTANLEQADAKAASLLGGGGAAVREMARLLPLNPQDEATSARYLLDSAVLHVNKPGNEAKKKVLLEGLAAEIGQTTDTQSSALLIDFLFRIDKAAAIPTVAKYVAHKELSERAVRALLNTGDKAVVAPLLKHLPKARGTVRTAIIYGMADLDAKEAAGSLTTLAKDKDPETRKAATYALAALGAPQAEAALAAAVKESTAPLAHGRALSWQVLYSDRIAQAGQKDKAVDILQKLLNETPEDQAHVQVKALSTLVDLQGSAALDTLIEMTSHSNSEVRNAALQLAQRLEDGDVIGKYTQVLDRSTSQSQAEILAMLGRRGDKAALETILKQLENSQPEVAAAAATAAYRLAGAEALPKLLPVVKSEDEPVLDAIRQALLQSKNEGLADQVETVLANASTKGKVMLLGVLADRQAREKKDLVMKEAHASERQVRTAAIKALESLAGPEDLTNLVPLLLNAKGEAERTAAQRTLAAVAKRHENAEERLKPLVEAYAGAELQNKEAILGTFAQLGGQQALELVSRETTGTQPEIQTAAIRALSDWTTTDALPKLLELTELPEENHHVLAMRGYIRLLDQDKMKPTQKAKAFEQALKIARRAEEKKQILTSLGDVRTTPALRAVVPYINQEDFKAEASLAATKIVLPRGRRDDGVRDAEGVAALLRAIPNLQEAAMKKRAEKFVYEVNYEIETTQPTPDEEGFVSLFNGTDLTGWTGSTDGYEVQEGAIVCIPKKGGNLYTQRQFDNFVLRFEFKLTPGANNGLGIRAPLQGDAAFEAMELQILDNTGHKNLKPWQLHGSIYGVAEAKDGALKPAGEWNVQEVTARDGNISVVLNGTKIVEANVWEIPVDKTLDGRPHPGLHRKEGHIGFLGHGSRIDVKNIRIKELINEAPEGFTALFNGKDLSGWKGLVENPIKRKAMSTEELAKAQAAADELLKKHWKVVNGVLVFDGDGSHACTTKDYSDFEMLVDWKIGPNGDSGIYLRGSPQVQIWDPANWPVGSGGLYNNQKNTSSPLVTADSPIGQWNRFRIKMVGENVTVHLNDKLVVDNTPLENYWDRKQPIFPIEQIELQSHGSPAYFRNIFIRELK